MDHSSAIDRVARALKQLRPDFTLTNARTFAEQVLAAPAGVYGERPLAFLPGRSEVAAHSQHTRTDAVPALVPAVAALTAPVPVVSGAPGQFQSAFGVSADGQPVDINWAEHPGLVMGGAPGTGKSAAVLTMAAGFAGRAELHVADGKQGIDLEPLAPICRTFDNRGGYAGGGLYALLSALTFMVGSGGRSEVIRSVTGGPDFWASEPAIREAAGLHPIVIVIDECQYWSEPANVSTADLDAASAIAGMLYQLIAGGRRMGIAVILTTQKPDRATIHAGIRASATQRIAFRVLTRAQAAAILDTVGDDAGTCDIAAGDRGRCVVRVGDDVPMPVRAHHLSADAAERALRRSRRVPDQFELACGFPLEEAMDAVRRGVWPPNLHDGAGGTDGQ